ncbi:MAG: MbnP family protein [Ekhidna sp.]
MRISPIHLKIKIDAIVLILFASLCSCDSSENNHQQALTLNFDAAIGNQRFHTGEIFEAPVGSGTFRIERFKLYISNLILTNVDGEDYLVPNSYHLLDFSEPSLQVDIPNVPVDNYNRLSFMIGVDEVSNKSIDHVGDLDPTNDMVWNWNVGYKFLLLEGNYFPSESNETIGLVYHIGFDENTRRLEYEIKEKSPSYSFRLNVNSLFDSQHQIDFNELSNITFSKADARKVADNYSDGFIQME